MATELDNQKVNEIYLSIMKQMDIDFDKELNLIKSLKNTDANSINDIQEKLSLDRNSFFTKYSWTVIPYFFHIDSMRKDYLSKSAERCNKIYDEIYNS